VLSIELNIHLCTYNYCNEQSIGCALMVVIATAGASRQALRSCLADGNYPIITLCYRLFNVVGYNTQYCVLIFNSTFVLMYLLLYLWRMMEKDTVSLPTSRKDANYNNGRYRTSNYLDLIYDAF